MITDIMLKSIEVPYYTEIILRKESRTIISKP